MTLRGAFSTGHVRTSYERSTFIEFGHELTMLSLYQSVCLDDPQKQETSLREELERVEQVMQRPMLVGRERRESI